MTPDQIKSIRHRLGLSQEQFAERLYTHRVTVAKWETGKHEPRGVFVMMLKQLDRESKQRGGRSRGK